MPDDKAAIRTAYPLPSYQYSVDVGDETGLMFSEVNGLTVEIETATYKHGMSFKTGAIHMPMQTKEINLTLKKGIFRGDSKLYTWISETSLNAIDKRDITINLLDDEYNPVVTWVVYNAFPKKLETGGFNASNNDVSVETLELMADSLQVTYH